MVSYIQVLNNEYLERRERNQRYSLRAFAVFLGISVTSLTMVMKKERHLSLANLQMVAKKLNWQPEQLKKYEEEIRGIDDRRRATRRKAAEPLIASGTVRRIGGQSLISPPRCGSYKKRNFKKGFGSLERTR